MRGSKRVQGHVVSFLRFLHSLHGMCVVSLLLICCVLVILCLGHDVELFTISRRHIHIVAPAEMCIREVVNTQYFVVSAQVQALDVGPLVHQILIQSTVKSFQSRLSCSHREDVLAQDWLGILRILELLVVPQVQHVHLP